MADRSAREEGACQGGRCLVSVRGQTDARAKHAAKTGVMLVAGLSMPADHKTFGRDFTRSRNSGRTTQHKTPAMFQPNNRVGHDSKELSVSPHAFGQIRWALGPKTPVRLT